MVSVPVHCPPSQHRSHQGGQATNGTQRYRWHLPTDLPPVGKLIMQKIERTHLTLRTRLKRWARKSLCFSRSCVMHELLIGLYRNRVEFGCKV